MACVSKVADLGVEGPRVGRWLIYDIIDPETATLIYVGKTHKRRELRLPEVIHHDEDHVLILDLGPADAAGPGVVSLSKGYDAPTRQGKLMKQKHFLT